MKYIGHISYPGFGYIFPIMDEDDPLIEQEIAKRLVEAFQAMRDGYSLVDWDDVCILKPEMKTWFDY